MESKKKLKEILQGVNIKSVEGNININISGIAADSKAIRENFAFIAVNGTSVDGHNYIEEAVKKGADVVVAQEDFLETGAVKAVTKVLVVDSRKASAQIAHNFYDRPCDKARVVGITGTNGKTTVSYLCESIFKEAGFGAGVIGTINYRYGLRMIPATNTTPGALKLAEIMNYMVANGANYIVMEASSHSLDQERVWAIDFKTAVFTNITPEHLDYHKNMLEYKRAKAILFRGLQEGCSAVLNIDDCFGKELADELKTCRVLRYGLNADADIRPEKFSLSSAGTELTAVTPKGIISLHSKLPGKFNLYNILASIGAGIAEGISLEKIAAGIELVKLVPGRLERVVCNQPFDVYVDYAHTDDALKNVLTAIKELAPGRIITLFGCGGDRDVTKRPRMARVASEFSDYIVITTDNPRSEDPKDIAEQVVAGIVKDKLSKTFVVLDRLEAIKKAIGLAKEGDIVLLAGKGHETYQIFKNMIQPFDDREVAKKILSNIGYTHSCSR